jgi:hypothetical protein
LSKNSIPDHSNTGATIQYSTYKLPVEYGGIEKQEPYTPSPQAFRQQFINQLNLTFSFSKKMERMLKQISFLLHLLLFNKKE